jgi:hypothetical protein
MKQYRYVIVGEDAQSIDLSKRANWPQDEEETAYALQDLMDDGWLPVRETALGRGVNDFALALVLLEKDG